ncbi:B-cell receptor CD22-like [Trachinotus anak]|uniref:B-cell receptor CD22-like n=1 Tax=Trachinotus anak TaxID=443729 RepID=UPI0039F20651
MESWILLVLGFLPGVWSGSWGVAFENQCALKGTSVVIKCRYNYPPGHFVTSVWWSKAHYISGKWRLTALSSLPSPPDYSYVGNKNGNCDLEIKNVRHADEGAYFFSFTTTLNRWTSQTYIDFSVKELTTVVQPSTVTEGDTVSLTCVTGCPTPTNIVWFRDGQLVPKQVFQARREDAGLYDCAALEQITVRSNPVALNVQYAPKRVTLSVSPSGDVVQGSSATFTCSSEANPPVTPSGYSLYKDGQFISSGQNHTISDIQPSLSGLYLCQAWNNISRRGVDLINSTEIHLDVQYRPTNISVSANPPRVVEGGSVNLTCSSVANPATVNYTWYKRTDEPGSSSMLQVGSGQVLSLPSMKASHTGLYLCQASNSVGEGNSNEMLLTMTAEQGSQLVPVLAAVGAFVIVVLLIMLLFFWRKHRTHAEEKHTVFDSRLRGKGSSSSDREVQTDTVYANIHTFPPTSPPVAAPDVTSHSQRNSHHENVTASYEAEVTYSAVNIKPRNLSRKHHINNSRAPQDSWSKDESVIYATVVTSD